MKNRISFSFGYLLFLIFFHNVNSIAEDLDFYVDKTNWLDPNDPLNNIKKKTPQISETCLRECDDSQWIKVLLIFFVTLDRGGESGRGG